MPGFSVDEILGLKVEGQKSVSSLKSSQHQRMRASCDGKMADSIETFSIEGPLKIIKYSNGSSSRGGGGDKHEEGSDVEEVLEYDEDTETLVDEDDGMSSGSEGSQNNRRKLFFW